MLWTYLVHFCGDLTNRSKSFKSRLQGTCAWLCSSSHASAEYDWSSLMYVCDTSHDLWHQRGLYKQCCIWYVQCFACSAELLTAIHAQVPAPPDAVLTHFDLDALLDGTTPTTPTVPSTIRPLDHPPESSSSAAAGDAASGGLNTEALAAAVSQDPDAWLHAELYNMLAQCEPDVFERLSESQLLKQQGHDQIVEHLQLTRFDLCYHPRRYDSWERVLSES